jgi:long-chain acyl-CoA synthetase
MAEVQRSETILDIFNHATRAFASRPLFGVKKAGQWGWVTYAEVGKAVDQARHGLAGLGVGKGDRVAIIASNCVEWAVGAYASYGRSASYVPMYAHQPEKDWEHILRNSESKVLFVGTRAIYERARRFLGEIPTLQHIVVIDEGFTPRDGEQALSYGDLLLRGSRDDQSGDAIIAPVPTDIAGYTYTSGTMGVPKGVLMMHANIIHNVREVQKMFEVGTDERSLCFLPWAHCLGQCELHILMSLGACLAFVESIDKIIDNLAEVRPTLIVAVPRIFNQLHKAVQLQLGGSSRVNQRIVAEAQRVTAKVRDNQPISLGDLIVFSLNQLQSTFQVKLGGRPQVLQRMVQAAVRAAGKVRDGQPLTVPERVVLSVTDKLVFSKVRAKFGGRLRFAVTGGAAMSREVAEFVDSLGIMVYEGYGLTETAAISTVNYPGHRRMGSVGRPIPGVRIDIDPSAVGGERDGFKEGELIIHGPNVMAGYHNLPDENSAVFTEGHGLRTGDLGYVDADGYVFITGRIKEQYKLDNGKYVVPTTLEEELKLSQYILNVMVYGDNRPCNVAIVVANVAAVKGWAAQHGLTLDGQQLLSHPKVRGLIEAEIGRLSEKFKGFESVRAFALIDQDFTVGNGMLTPSLKLKRAKVLEVHGATLEALYANKPCAQAAKAQAA